MTDPTYGQLFSDALVSEIKAEMGRRDLSSRGLGRLIGKSSQYMSDRLDGGSPKTGRRVLLSAQDIGAISQALGMRPSELTLRAHFVALGGDPGLSGLLTDDHRASSHALAASDDDDWERRQEAENE